MFCSADKVWKYNFKEFSFAMGYKRVYMNLICRMWLVRGKFYHFPCTFPWPSLLNSNTMPIKLACLLHAVQKRYKHSSEVLTELGNSLYKYFTFSMGYIFLWVKEVGWSKKKSLLHVFYIFQIIHFVHGTVRPWPLSSETQCW